MHHKEMKHVKKGAGTTISAVLIVMVLLFFLYVFIATSANSSQKKLELNLNTIDFLKVKNTVSILNRSLSTTWFVSAAQMTYKAGDLSLGCGYDDYFDPDTATDVTKAGYWYQYNDTAKKREPNPLPAAGSKYNMRIPVGGLKETIQPRICYPADRHFTDFMDKNFVLYSDIQKKFTLNGIDFSLDKIAAAFDLTDDRVVSRTSQEIKANTAGSNPFILATTSNANTIFTGFRQMMASGRKIVELSISMAASLNPGQRAASELLYTPNVLAGDYKKNAKEKIDSRFRSAVAAGKFRIDVKYKPGNDIGLRAGDDSETGLGFQLAKQGLVMHYDADIKITEKAGGAANLACSAIRQDISDLIKNEAGRHSPWAIGDPVLTTQVFYAPEEMENYISAIVQAESRQDAKAISECGAAGLMQLMPGTAASGQDPITDIFENARFTDCENDYADRLANAIEGKTDDEIKRTDGRFDPPRNVRRGVSYISALFTTMKKYTSEKQEMLKLAAAAYNTGEPNVINAIEKAKDAAKFAGAAFDEKDVKYEDIRDFLPSSETRNFVEIVMNLFACYDGGGMQPAANYDWPTPSRYITSCFGPRPAPVPGASTNHKGIDIGIDRGPDVSATESGTVEDFKEDCKQGDESCGGIYRGYGNWILVDNSDGLKTLYAHLKEGSASASGTYIGRAVAKGDKIAEIGSTGISSGPHLHFEVLQNGKQKNPCNYILCSESSSDKKCDGTVEPTLLEGLYYYHDEKSNTFAPRPFELGMSVEDNLNVLDCVNDVSASSAPYTPYGWSAGRDMACCGGALWTCNAQPEINNIGNHALRTGESILTQDDPKPIGAQPSRSCAGAVSNSLPNPDNDKYTLGCTPQGFFTVGCPNC